MASRFRKIMQYSKTEIEALVGVRNWVLKTLDHNDKVLAFYEGSVKDRPVCESPEWKELAVIRILDYIDHAGMNYRDPNLRGESAINNPIKMIW